MEDISEKSQWAFDCRPWEGGRWHEDLPDEGMKTKYPQGKMVHIGIKQEWDPSETGVVNRGKYGSWTRPLIPGAEKAKWGTTNEGRYLCCDDLDNCGVVCIVAQGEQQAWNFRRQPPEYRSRKPNTCINQRKWFGESMYHNLTKRHVARTLDLASWKEEFGIASVHLEQKITFQWENESIPLQPDIHVVLKDGERLYIEVVYKNPPKRLHHDLYGEGLAIIDLRDEANRVVLSSDDEDERIKCYRSWVREGGIEEALREELNLQRRQVLFQRRQENFERNNITVVKEYLSEVGEEPGTKWHLLSEESIQNLENKIEEGMSKDMVRALYLEILERQALDKEIEIEIRRVARIYPFYKAGHIVSSTEFDVKQFDSVEEILPFFKQNFYDEIEEEINTQRKKHGFEIEFEIVDRNMNAAPHHEVNSRGDVHGAYRREAPMRKKQFEMQEESGLELNIRFQNGAKEVYVEGAVFYGSAAHHITEIYQFARPILEENEKWKDSFGFDANLQYNSGTMERLTNVKRDEGWGRRPHYAVIKATEVKKAYETENEYRNESNKRKADWPQFLEHIKKECEEILRPRLEDIRERIEEQENNEQVQLDGDIRNELIQLIGYEYWSDTSLEMLHAQMPNLEILPNYRNQLNDKCPEVLLHRSRRHMCFNLEFLGIKDLLDRYDRAKTDTMAGARYTTSKAARVVERMSYLVNREQYFSRLTYVLGRGGTRQWITVTEAKRILRALEMWNGMERVESIDWCIEKSVETEDALLNCLGLQKDSLTINGLSDTELLKQFHFGPYE